MSKNAGNLFVIATPIGNLSDITERALEVLRSADLVVCEDTRVTKKLLFHYKISRPIISFYERGTMKNVQRVLLELAQGKQVALVSDAGTPGISDPGNILVAHVVEQNKKQGIFPEINIVPIPGPSAVVAALSISGFPTNAWRFIGFPPHKKKRKKFFEAIKDREETIVFFESCHRLHSALDALSDVFGKEKSVCVCRELTKHFETVYRGSIQDILSMDIPEKGECVVVIGGAKG